MKKAKNYVNKYLINLCELRVLRGKKIIPNDNTYI
jgi:hypothetical protein